MAAPLLRHRRPPHRTVSAPISSSALTAALLKTDPVPPPLLSPSAPFLLNYADLPAWQQDNAFIRTSYRPPIPSYRRCIQSLFYLHNESVNIHSHLLGSFVFFFVGVALLLGLWSGEGGERGSGWEKGEVLMLGWFFGGAVVCLGCSAWYHCVSCYGEEVNGKWQRMDHFGVVLLIVGSFVPSSGVGWSCDRGVRWGYWGMMTLIGLACTAASLNPRFRTPSWRPYRTAIFVAMGISAAIPVIHGIQLYGFTQMSDRIGLPWLALHGLLYIIGAGIYAARIPERFAPGRFDIWGSSHQIFHILILLAATSHLVGLLEAFEHKRTALVC